MVIKLNGGLGTSMGMDRAKSLLEVKDGMAFLDVIAEQIVALRRATGARIPLVLMNSFATRDDSLELLGRHPRSPPTCRRTSSSTRSRSCCRRAGPAEWPADPSLEWCPPGHGDIYTALLTSGMLGALIEHGYRYAFISNSDNLGAVLDPRILAWFAGEEIPYAAR